MRIKNLLRMELASIIEDIQRKLQVPALPATKIVNKAELMAWKAKLMDIWMDWPEVK